MLLQESGLEKENYNNYNNFCPLFSCETGGFHEQNWRFWPAKLMKWRNESIDFVQRFHWNCWTKPMESL